MADDNELINQADIEALLQNGTSGPSDEGVAPEPPSGPPSQTSGEIDQSEIENLLGGAGGPEAASQPTPVAAASVDDIDDPDKLLGQNDIEQLLNQSGAGTSAAHSAPLPPQPAPDAAPAREKAPPTESVTPGDVEFLFYQAEKALESAGGSQKELPPSASMFQFDEFTGSPANTETATLDLLNDVELDLKIELGRTNMYLEDVLKLRKGAVVPLDKLAGDPVDIYVNGRLIARGEVLVLNDNFCVRVAELVASTTPVV